MELRVQCQPLRRVEVQVGVQVLDVLPADDVGPAEVVVAEGIQRVEGVQLAAAGAAVARGVVVIAPDRRTPRQIFEVVTEAGGDHSRDHVLRRLAAELQRRLDVPQEAGIVPGVAGTERVDGEVPALQPALVDGVVVRQHQVVQIDRVPLLRAVGREDPGEVLLVVGPIELVRLRNHRLRPERVDVPFLAGAENAHPLKRPPGVGPVEVGDEPLRPEEQLLSADAEVRRLTHHIAEFEIEEEVQKIEPGLVDRQRRQVLRVRERRDPCGEQPDPVLVPQVAVDSLPGQCVRVVPPAQAAVVFFHLPHPRLPAEAEQKIVAEFHPFERIEEVVLGVVGFIEVSEIDVERRLPHQPEARVRVLRRRLARRSLHRVRDRIIPRPDRWYLERPQTGLRTTLRDVLEIERNGAASRTGHCRRWSGTQSFGHCNRGCLVECDNRSGFLSRGGAENSECDRNNEEAKDASHRTPWIGDRNQRATGRIGAVVGDSTDEGFGRNAPFD